MGINISDSVLNHLRPGKVTGAGALIQKNIFRENRVDIKK